MSGLRIAVVDAWELIEQLRDGDLIVDHWRELATDPEIMVLAPNYPAYRELYDKSALLAVAAYDGDFLVGYSVSVLSYSMHYKALVVAHNDVLYLDPTYRSAKTGLALIEATEAAAHDLLAEMVCWHAKADTPLHHLLKSREPDYRVQDVIFSRRL